MRQDLIDLMRGELDEARAEEVRAAVRNDPELARELNELTALFSLMRRGEEIEPPASMRAQIAAAAERAVQPSLWERVRQVPSLMRFRFRQSVVFRIAAVSLGVHLLAMATLFVTLDRPKAEDRNGNLVVRGPNPEDDLNAQRPDASFVGRLKLRRLPHTTRLRQYGVAGHQEAIQRGLETLLASQATDGSFGDVRETAHAALALLAEGDCSMLPTRRGRAIHAAMETLLDDARAGATDAALLAALVEDYALGFEDMPDERRLAYTRAIRRLIREVGAADPMASEALVLASMASFYVPTDRDLGRAGLLLKGDRSKLLASSADRFGATVVLARGHLSVDRARVKSWSNGLFANAVKQIEAGNRSGLVLLTLQAPYRL